MYIKRIIIRHFLSFVMSLLFSNFIEFLEEYHNIEICNCNDGKMFSLSNGLNVFDDLFFQTSNSHINKINMLEICWHVYIFDFFMEFHCH